MLFKIASILNAIFHETQKKIAAKLTAWLTFKTTLVQLVEIFKYIFSVFCSIGQFRYN